MSEISDQSITVNWNAVDHATNYTVAYFDDNGQFIELAPTTNTSYTINNVVSGKTYVLKVRANGDGNDYLDSQYSEANLTVTVKTKLATPTINASSTTNSITVNWNAVANASGYLITYVVDGQETSVTVNGVSYTLPGLNSGDDYTIAVKAVGTGDHVDSDYSDSLTVMVKSQLDAPTITATSSDHNSVSVSWNAVANTSGYTVTYAVAGTSDWSTAQTTTTSDTHITISGLNSGTRYVVRVATNGDQTNYVDSDYSATDAILVKTKLPYVPSITDVNVDSNSITATWSAAPGMGYTLEYAVSGTNQFVPMTVSATTYTIGNLVSETTYDLRVKANGDGDYYVDSDYSVIVSVTVKKQLEAPTIVNTSSTTDSIVVSWNAVKNASEYTIAYAVEGAEDFNYIVESSSSITINDLVPNQTYIVKVKANGVGNYVDSEFGSLVSVTVKTQIATPEITTWLATINTITIDWTSSVGATKYYLQYREFGASDFTTISTPPNETSHTFDSLSSGTTFEFRIRAVGDGIVSVSSPYGSWISVSTEIEETDEESPSTIVTTLDDVVDSYDGLISLREAIAYANPEETVTFDASLNNGTITLCGEQLEIAKAITVDGSELDSIMIDADGLSRVFYLSANNITLKGLTITGGNAGEENGGGAYVLDGLSASIIDCAIIGNTATRGGGVCALDGNSSVGGTNVSIVNCEITGNTATSLGGGAYGGTVTNCMIANNKSASGGGVSRGIITNCTITNNEAAYGGGAMDGRLTNCLISGNTAYFGGGVECGTVGTVTVVDCVITENTARQYGGGVHGGIYVNCIISGNTSNQYGGGAVVAGSTSLTNCLITNNTANVGDDVYAVGSSIVARITNCTIVGDIGDDSNAGFYVAQNSVLNISNTIIAEEIFKGENASLTANNTLSNYTSWDAGENNYVYDPTQPLFMDAANGDFTLATDSVAINVGNVEYLPSGVITDLGGLSRVVNGIVDLGAYEYQGEFEDPSVPESPSIIVTTALDVVDPFDGLISLREAIEYANLGDMITFDCTLSGATILLDENNGSLLIAKGVTIDASALESGITIDGAGFENHVFEVKTTDVSLIGLTITGAGRAESGGYSGVIVWFNDSIEVVDCVLVNNYEGIWVCGNGVGRVVNCVVENNYYGISALWDASVTIENCAITHNEGEGVYAYASSVEIIDSLIADNDYFGVYACTIARENEDHVYYGSVTAYNTTITGNRNYGIFSSDASIDLYNCIVAQNPSYDYYDRTGTSTVNAYNSLSTYAQWNSGTGNFIYDSSRPLFVGDGDYRLAENSQAINVGNNEYVRSALDLDGTVRIQDGTVDLGAYEYQTEFEESPSTIVTTLDDVVDAYDGLISLREAVVYANSGDTVTFDASLNNGTITLCGEQLEVGKELAIDASSLESITIDAAGLSRVFYLNADNIELNGLTITGGYASSNNGATSNGAGIHINAANASLVNCIITDNTAYAGGGVYAAFDCSTTLTHCTIARNTAVFGGGAHCSVATFIDCEIYDNIATTTAGGVYSGTLIDCTISGNTAARVAGGVYMGTLTNCAIQNNTAEEGGGVVNSLLTNCLITGNTAIYGGGASDSTPTNCTIVGNTATYGAGYYFWGHWTRVVKNSIILDEISVNEAASENASLNGYNNLSCFTTWSNGSNNYVYDQAAPLFTDSENGDYTLANDSIAINAGNGAYLPEETTTDLAGLPRVALGEVDLGAYEKQTELDAALFDEFFDELEEEYDVLAANVLTK